MAADKRKLFGSVRADFCQEKFSLLVHIKIYLKLFSFALHTSVSVGAVGAVGDWGCFGANGGCLVEDASGLMSSKCEAERCILLVTDNDALEFKENRENLACTADLIRRCALGVKPSKPQSVS